MMTIQSAARTNASVSPVSHSAPPSSVVSSLRGPRRTFVAATSEALLHLGVSNDVEYALLPLLLRRLRMEAPGVQLAIVRVDSQQLPGMLARGEVSLGIGPDAALGFAGSKQLLRTVQPILLRTDSMPGSVSVEEFCRRPHASVSCAANLDRQVDSVLSAQGRQRKVAISVSQFNLLPGLMARTDLLALVPDYVAAEMIAKGGFRSEAAPVANLSFKLSMAWNTALFGHDPAQRWLRARCAMFLGEQPD